MNPLLLLLLIAQADTFDWGVAEKALRQERAQTAACDTMRTDTAAPDYTHFKAPKKEKKSIHNVMVMDTRNIDSIQAIEDSVGRLLYGDPQFRKMKGFDIADMVGFFNHVLHYKQRDTAAVQTACFQYIKIMDCKYQQLLLILENQHDDTRASIYLHIKKNRNDAGIIGGYLYSITE
jgi:hypothetical protein